MTAETYKESCACGGAFETSDLAALKDWRGNHAGHARVQRPFPPVYPEPPFTPQRPPWPTPRDGYRPRPRIWMHPNRRVAS